jgi:hypothetical protein
MAMVSTVLAGFSASCASDTAIAATTGAAASSATRRGARRAWPASAMKQVTRPGPSDCGQSSPAPHSPSPIRAITTSRVLRTRSLSPTVQQTAARISAATETGRAAPPGDSSASMPAPTPSMVTAPTGTSHERSRVRCASSHSRVAPFTLDPTFLAGGDGFPARLRPSCSPPVAVRQVCPEYPRMAKRVLGLCKVRTSSARPAGTSACRSPVPAAVPRPGGLAWQAGAEGNPGMSGLGRITKQGRAADGCLRVVDDRVARRAGTRRAVCRRGA